MFAALSDLVATAVAAASPRGLEEEQERAEALVDKARARAASGDALQRDVRPQALRCTPARRAGGPRDRRRVCHVRPLHAAGRAFASHRLPRAWRFALV